MSFDKIKIVQPSPTSISIHNHRDMFLQWISITINNLYTKWNDSSSICSIITLFPEFFCLRELPCCLLTINQTIIREFWRINKCYSENSDKTTIILKWVMKWLELVLFCLNNTRKYHFQILLKHIIFCRMPSKDYHKQEKKKLMKFLTSNPVKAFTWMIIYSLIFEV